METELICTKCDLVKDIEAFHPSRRHKNGITGRCQECFDAYHAAYRAANRDRQKYHNEKRSRENPDYNKTYLKEYNKRPEVRARRKEYDSQNAEKRRERERQAYSLDSSKKREQVRAWQKANPEKKRANYDKRRARKLGGDHEPYSRAEIFERDQWTCQLCLKPVDSSLVFPHVWSKTIDHIIPLSKGGADAPDNVQLAHLRCNIQKGNRVQNWDLFNDFRNSKMVLFDRYGVRLADTVGRIFPWRGASVIVGSISEAFQHEIPLYEDRINSLRTT